MANWTRHEEHPDLPQEPWELTPWVLSRGQDAIYMGRDWRRQTGPRSEEGTEAARVRVTIPATTATIYPRPALDGSPPEIPQDQGSKVEVSQIAWDTRCDYRHDPRIVVLRATVDLALQGF